ncbi:MAG: DUF2155 domain-containing protein [Magnetovibrio sp.]|nr:DUF2155 domain-containing protein [Magnetovibrio sp.]
MKRFLLALLSLSFLVLNFMVTPVYADPYQTAVLQGLDKVTARVTTLRTSIGGTVRFGTLDVIVRHCDKRPPEETPESAAFLDIWERREGEPALDLFRGWMFASSPGLNALEHPVYDIWLLDCENILTNSEPSTSSGGEAGN